MTSFEPTLNHRPQRHWSEVAIDVALMLVAAASATLLIATAPVGSATQVSAQSTPTTLAAAPDASPTTPSGQR